MAVRYKFRDEFDGPAGSAPASHWTYALGGGGWGNNELEVYTNSRANSFLDGKSNLVIRATKDNGVYHSARLLSPWFAQYHGTWEARIKLNVQRGCWPAWWAMGDNMPWPQSGEVDMLENYGGKVMETSVHTPDDAGTGALTKSQTQPVDNNWHVWRMACNSAAFVFYKDGIPYLTAVPTDLDNWCFGNGVPLWMIANMAVGGAGGSPASTVFPIDMLIDYIRVW